MNKGMPFRQAHHVVGEVVALSESSGKLLNKLSLKELKSIYPKFQKDVLEMFHLKSAMERRRVVGSPGDKEVSRQLRIWKKQLGK